MILETLYELIFNLDKDLVALLITNGADLNLMNEDGETPLDHLSSEELEGASPKPEDVPPEPKEPRRNPAGVCYLWKIGECSWGNQCLPIQQCDGSLKMCCNASV